MAITLLKPSMGFREAILSALLVIICSINNTSAQTAYYIDGYHGGVWGHYPDWNTRFMADQVKAHPDRRINLEIEPETWDVARVKDSAAYEDFRALFADQSINAKMEYVNPDYAQSYLFDVEGESMISQFYYGIKMIRQHFPTAVFPVYSSEEPCFTSALPEILTSYGFKYASLKNPNTCWGGYTSAYGGEIVNWVGPDGTKVIITSPRYAIEALQPGSAWQTIASGNSPEYIKACFAAGIAHPIGMTLQDAGWKYGPNLRDGSKAYQPTQYTTWRNYFENVAIKSTNDNWKFTQEDVLVSLVWGSQILQQIAQEVRYSENKIISAEKLAAMAKIYSNTPYPTGDFENAWHPLLLSQHHDCWIVPYNGKPGNTWSDKVVRWTGITNRIADSLIMLDEAKLAKGTSANGKFIRVYNTLGVARNEVVSVNVPDGWKGKSITVLNSAGKPVVSQIVSDSITAVPQLLFSANVPSMGYSTWQLKLQKTAPVKNMVVNILSNGNYKVESDLYSIIIDPKKGGVITSLIAKKLNNKEFVDKANPRSFNELRGNFYNDGGFHSSTETPAKITVLEKGAERVKLQIQGLINGSPFTQWLTLTRGQRRIDMQVKIDWNGNPGIGEYTEPGTYKATGYKKAFYNDKEKLLAMFPLNLKAQKVYKNAPFDVLQSRLKNTFFTTWDSIKNNIILNWVDVTDGNDAYGMALLTDHTTNYTHGEDFPLGLTLEYSGVGLWGRDYKITGPTNIHYAIVPHTGKWDKAGLWTEGTKWNEPLITQVLNTLPSKDGSKSLLNVAGTGYDISAMKADGNDLSVRVFNAEGDDAAHKITFDGSANKAELVELDGRIIENPAIQKDAAGHSVITLSIPRFGIRTIKLHNAVNAY